MKKHSKYVKHSQQTVNIKEIIDTSIIKTVLAAESMFTNARHSLSADL